MPTINVQMFEGRTLEQRRKLAKELTEGTCRALGCTPDAVQIILTDIKKENWAEAGKLFSDKPHPSKTSSPSPPPSTGGLRRKSGGCSQSEFRPPRYIATLAGTATLTAAYGYNPAEEHRLLRRRPGRGARRQARAATWWWPASMR